MFYVNYISVTLEEKKSHQYYVTSLRNIMYIFSSRLLEKSNLSNFFLSAMCLSMYNCSFKFIMSEEVQWASHSVGYRKWTLKCNPKYSSYHLLFSPTGTLITCMLFPVTVYLRFIKISFFHFFFFCLCLSLNLFHCSSFKFIYLVFYYV